MYYIPVYTWAIRKPSGRPDPLETAAALGAGVRPEQAPAPVPASHKQPRHIHYAHYFSTSQPQLRGLLTHSRRYEGSETTVCGVHLCHPLCVPPLLFQDGGYVPGGISWR